MDNKKKDTRNIKLTEEQMEQAAKNILNSWLRNNGEDKLNKPKDK